jgi:hypothetical protein
VQVKVSPVEGNLESVVQVGYVAVTPDQNPAPTGG